MGPPSYMRSVVDRNVVMRRMAVHDHSIENNDISIQFIYFTRRNTQYCNNTKQSKAQGHSTIYWIQQNTTPFTLRSQHMAVRPIYRVPQNAAGCDCCWQASSRYGQANVFHVLFKTRGPLLVLGRLWNIFTNGHFLQCALKHRAQPRCWRDRTARPLYKMLIDTADWHSARVTKKKMYITCTNTNATYILLWENCCYTLLQECNHDHTWHIATVQLL